MPKQDNNNQKTDTGSSQIPPVPTSTPDPLPPVFSDSPDDVTPPMDAQNPSPANSVSDGSAAPTNDISSTPMATTSSNGKEPKKKYGGGKGKIIAAIFGVLLLVGSVGAGVILVRQNQDVRERAASDSYRLEKKCRQKDGGYKWCLIEYHNCANNSGGPVPCSAHTIDQTSCTEVTEPCAPPGGSGSPTPAPTPTPKPLQCNSICNTNAECAAIDPGYKCVVTNSSNPDNIIKRCRNFSCTNSNTCVCPPTPTPPAAYRCVSIFAFDTNWNRLTADQLTQLKAGDVVRFTVRGENTTINSNGFNAVRFTINGEQVVSQTKRPGYPNQYYTDYTIPEGVTDFNIRGLVTFVGQAEL